MKKIITRTAEISYDELTRILKVKIIGNSEIGLADALQNYEATKKLTKEDRFLVLVDGRVPLSVSREARAYSAQARNNEGRIAEAFIVTSTANKLLANFYINVNKPKIPTRCFSNEEDAVQWLEGFLYRTQTEQKFISAKY